MLILSFIIGGLLIAGGITLCFTPLNGFLQIGQIIAIAMLLSGATGLTQCIINRSFRGDFFLSLLGVLAGAFLMHDPLMRFMTDNFVLYTVAVWLVIEGACQIWLCISCKLRFFSRWWLVLIAGILNLVLGIFTFLNPLVGMLALGLMLAFYFIDAGLGMILCALAFRE